MTFRACGAKIMSAPAAPKNVPRLRRRKRLFPDDARKKALFAARRTHPQRNFAPAAPQKDPQECFRTCGTRPKDDTGSVVERPSTVGQLVLPAQKFCFGALSEKHPGSAAAVRDSSAENGGLARRLFFGPFFDVECQTGGRRRGSDGGSAHGRKQWQWFK